MTLTASSCTRECIYLLFINTTNPLKHNRYRHSRTGCPPQPLAGTGANCLPSYDMPTNTSNTQTATRQRQDPPATHREELRRLKELASTTSVPLLELLAPDPDDWTDDGWLDKLKWLRYRYGVTPAWWIEKGIPKATVHAWFASQRGQGGRGLSDNKKRKLAKIAGFEMSWWYLPIDEFDARIRARYPEWNAEFGDDFGANDTDIDDNGGDADVVQWDYYALAA